MEAMRESWTDDRLDDLSHRMDGRFDQIEGQIADTRMEMRTTANSLRSEVKELRDEIKTSGDELRGEIKAQGKELRGEIAGVEARLRSQASQQRADSWEQFGRVHEDMQQLNAAILDLHRTITRIGWSAAIALAAAFIGVLITNL